MSKKSAVVTGKLIISGVALIYLLFHNTSSLHAQSIDLDPINKSIDGITNIATSVISDSFTPMTHYKTGDYVVSLIPAYFRIQKAYDDPEVRGDSLSGYAIGGGFGYSPAKNIMFYGIISHMNIDGSIKGTFYRGYSDGVFKMKVKYKITSFNTGIGYDFIGDSDSFSVPVYLGVFTERYSASGELPQYLTQADMSIYGSSWLGGVTFGIAPSYQYAKKFRITPYFLYSRSLNSPKVTARERVYIMGTHTYYHDCSAEKVKTGMIGLSTTWLSTDRFSISINVGGWVRNSGSWYNDKFLNGLKMKSAILVVSYRN